MQYSPPFGLRNGHVNTILGSNGPRKWRVRKVACAFEAKSEPHVLDCGDGVRLHGLFTPNEDRSDKPSGLVVLIHGWEGTAHSTYLLSAALRLYQEGFSVFRLHLRDHGPSHALNELPFLAVRLDEVMGAMKEIEVRFGSTPVYLAGYSLGGNIVVRVAAHASTFGIRLDRAVAICPVTDPYHVAKAIEKYPIYQAYFMHKWKKSLRKKLALFGDRPAYADKDQMAEIMNCRQFISMHDALLPLFSDYKEAKSYFDAYALSSDNLSAMETPCQIILAKDDPIIPVQTKQGLPHLDGLSVRVSDFGGHCGFVEDYSLGCIMDEWLTEMFGRG